MHAFSECGPGHSKLLAEGAFPALIRALHDSDVSLHAHPQVVLVYFEISHRYIRYLSRDAILRLCQALLGRQGVQSGNVQLRGRAAYLLLKVAESQEGKNADVVDSVYAQLSGEYKILRRTSFRSLRARACLLPLCVTWVSFHRSNVTLEAFRLCLLPLHGAKSLALRCMTTQRSNDGYITAPALSCAVRMLLLACASLCAARVCYPVKRCIKCALLAAQPMSNNAQQ